MLSLMIMLLADAPSGLETGTAAASATVLRPALPANFPGTWATTNDYPLAALRAMEQGATEYALTVSPTGRVASCLVTLSSGSTDLDEATCRLVSDRARFAPATDARGRAVAGQYSSRVHWLLPSTRGALKPGTLAFRFVIAPDGSKRDCEVTEAEGGMATRAAVGAVPCAAIPFNGRYVNDNGEGETRRVTITQTVLVETAPQ